VNGVSLVLYLVVFPGFLFLLGLAWFGEWWDRKLTARFQDRVGPPLVQPFADFVKLLAKEDIVTEGVSARLQAALPLVAFAAVATAFLYVPVVGASPFGAPGDLVLVLYLLTLPTVLLFVLGWTSRNVFARIGAVRAATQLFVYEVPFFLGCLGPALAAGTWTLGDIVTAQSAGLWTVLLQPLGFVVAIVALQAKLERTPFDIPEAETELVAGPLTEITGRKLAIWNLGRDIALVTGAGLLAALFLGGPTIPGVSVAGLAGMALGFLAFLLKVLLILAALAAIRAGVARIRIDQLVTWGWAFLTPLALVQIALALVLKGVGFP
jgi:NADH-quinone oxidoreductase subunit H